MLKQRECLQDLQDLRERIEISQDKTTELMRRRNELIAQGLEFGIPAKAIGRVANLARQSVNRIVRAP